MKHPALITVLLGLGSHLASAACPPVAPPLRGLLEAEYAFAAAAGSSVRQAFLANLSDDSWVLQPTPTPGKAWYQAAPESDARLGWYPQLADIAASQDLGFTSGPWTYSKGPVRVYGHFLSLWRREADCRWRVVFDGGVSHARPTIEPARQVETVEERPPDPPGRAGGGEAQAFQDVAGREGLRAALRTYAKNGDFMLLRNDALPMTLDQAEQRRERPIKGPWQEMSRGQSQDGSLQYVLGRVERGSYVQIWQYDPKVANWGLRVLLLTTP